MGDITINGKNIITQSGAAEPVIASNVTGGAGLDAGDASTLTGVLPVGVTGGSGLTALGTVATGNLSNTAIVYPAGHMVYIKHLARNGYGSIGDQQNWYPTDMSGSDANKTLYLAVTGAEHAPYSKLKIDFTFDVRINKETHAFCGYRLARWQGSTTVSGSPTSLLQGQYGSASTGLPSNYESYDINSGNAIDDISGLSNTIYYAIQMRNAAGSGSYAGGMYFGAGTASRTQMIIYGII